MQEHHVGLGQQGVQIHVLGDGLAGVVGVQVVGQHLHAQGLGNAAGGLADAAEADDAGSLAVQLDERVVPVAPVDVVGPLALVDGLVVVADVVAHLQQQGDGVLSHAGGAVGGHVAHQHALLLGVVVVSHIVAGGQEGDQLHVGAPVDGLLGDGRLVGDDHLGVADALGNDGGLHIGGAVIDRHVAQLLQLLPAQIAGILGVTIQNYDFHSNTSFLKVRWGRPDQSSSRAQARLSTRLVLARTISSSSPGRRVTSMDRT